MRKYRKFLVQSYIVSFSLALPEERLVRRHSQSSDTHQVSAIVAGDGLVSWHRPGVRPVIHQSRNHSSEVNLMRGNRTMPVLEALEKHLHLLQQPETRGALPAGGFPIPPVIILWLNETLQRRFGSDKEHDEHDTRLRKVPVSALVDDNADGSSFYIVFFVLSLFVLSVIVAQLSDVVPAETAVCPELQSVRGRSCWLVVCPLVVVILSSLVFLATVHGIAIENFHIQKEPGWTFDGDHDIEGLVKYHKVQHPYERAFEAGQGVALSAAVAFLLISKWRHSGSVKASTALLAQFTFRGATLALAIALPLEIISDMFMRSFVVNLGLITTDEAKTKHAFLWYFMGMGLIPGLCEEIAKAVCIVCGTLLVASAARDRVASSTRSFCEKCWCLLVESPRALMLVGFSVGSGFMIAENAGYLIEVATEPPVQMQSIDTGDEENIGRTMLRILRIATMLIRTVLNVHPWLAALTAARVAKVAYAEKKSAANLSPQQLLTALAPAAFFHGLYDFLLTVGPSLFSIFYPPLFWFGLRNINITEWNQLAHLENSRPRASADEEPGNEAVTE